MSTATLELPTKTAAPVKAGDVVLPDLTQSFLKELKSEKAKEQPEGEAPKEPVKDVVKEVVADPVKEPVKEAPPKAKKSALDAALSDDAPVEKAPEPDEVAKLIESKDPNWEKARETMRRQSEKLKDFEGRKLELPPEVAAELKSAKELKAERDKLTAENAKLRDSIIALDVRFDPAVQERIAGRDKQATTLADRVADAGGNKEAFLAALDMPLSKRGKAIDAALEGIESQREITAINTRLGQIELIDEQLEEQLSKPHESFEQLKQKREIEAREHDEKVEQFKVATFERVQRELPKLSKLMRMAPEDSEGAGEYNTALKADLERAPTLLKVSPEEATLLSFKAARFDSAEKMVLASRARIAELETELAKYEGAEPGFRGGGKPKPKADHERSIQEVYAEALETAKGGGI